MSRKLSFAACLMLLSACSYEVTPPSVGVANQQCKDRGGWSSIRAFEHGKLLHITCNDGSLLEIRPANPTPSQDTTP